MIAETIEKLREILIGARPMPIQTTNRFEGMSKHVVVPPNYRVELLAETKPRPERVQQVVHFDELDSFAAYANQFGGQQTTIFLKHTQTSISMEAVIDYHDATHGVGACVASNWGEHRAEFRPVLTAEWVVWTENSKKAMEQTKFAEFLEDNRLDVVEPTSGTLIELCRDFQARSTVTYKKAYREKDGTLQFQFTAENGPVEKMDVPDSITLRIAPYQGEPLQDVEAKIRYRLADGRCVFYYELQRPHKVMEASAKEMREQIRELTREKGFPIFSGKMV